MRWNCPHCDELVTAGIDFENTKQAYVRCAQCNGTALIHRSAILADYVRARRSEEEAQLEAELRLTQSTSANSRLQAMEVQIRGLNERLSSAQDVHSRPIAPPPFRPSFEAIETGPPEFHATTPPPLFTYTKPPAFLLKPSPIETQERSFSTDESSWSDEPSVRIDTMTMNLNETSVDADLEHKANVADAPAESSLRPMIALWVAAALAIGSGAYLYREGKKALAPVNAPIQADEIHSKANSAVRPEVRSLVIVSVARAVLREGPSVEATPVQTLDRSSVARVVEEKEGWMKVESPAISTSDRTAWVRADLVIRMPN